MKLKHLAFSCAICSAFGVSNSIALDGIDVSELLDSLHQVQDEIARGDLTALSLQGVLSEKLKDGLESPLGAAKDEVEWATIAIGYALDGAKPQLSRRLLARISATNSLYALSKAVSEYSTGNMKDAAVYFDQIDLNKVDLRIAPYVALAAGTANLSLDEDKTIALFEKAILLGSGTLVEEVALRRLAQIGASTGDSNLLQRASNLYLRRYRASPFAGQFYALLVKEAPSVLNEQQLEDMGALIVTQLPNTYVPALLSLAESSAVKGQIEIVGHFMKTYLNDVKNLPNSISDRVKLYQIISGPWSNFDDKTLDSIKQISPEMLSPNEKILLGKLTTVLEDTLRPLTLIDESKSMKANELSQPAPKNGHEKNMLGHPEENTSDMSLVGQANTSANSKEIAEPAALSEISTTPSLPSSDPTQTTALPPNEPIIEQIDAIGSKTKDILNAVDALLKEQTL